MSVQQRWILLTGAARGIGEACLRQLVASGFRILAGVRSAADGERLTANHGDSVLPVRLDLTDGAQIEACAELAARTVGDAGLYGLVNNAGIAVGGPLEFVRIPDLRRQLEVNVTGQVALTQGMLPLIRRARGSGVERAGRIVFIGSISGLSTMPFTGAYAASKHALEAVADALRVELRPWGIEVVMIEPGSIATPIWDTSLKSATQSLDAVSEAMNERYGRLLGAVRRRVERAGQGLSGGRPESVARVVERALVADHPRTRYRIGRDARMRLLLKQVLPDRAMDAIIARGLDRLASSSS